MMTSVTQILGLSAERAHTIGLFPCEAAPELQSRRIHQQPSRPRPSPSPSASPADEQGNLGQGWCLNYGQVRLKLSYQQALGVRMLAYEQHGSWCDAARRRLRSP